MNDCTFSPDRVYRYSLVHRWDDLLTGPPRLVGWIGLNPSTADESHLDRTLNRIKGFSNSWGFTGFVMLNLFSFRATEPRDMKAAVEPIGRENDATLFQWASRVEYLVCCWGCDGAHRQRDVMVKKLLSGFDLRKIWTTGAGYPGHPLYLPKGLQPEKLD